MFHLIVLVTIATFGYTLARDHKHCFCKVVDFTSGEVIHDWGAIREHSAWIHVGCSRLRHCEDNCKATVTDWITKNPELCDGRKVRYNYKASVCGSGNGNQAMACRCVTNDCKTDVCHNKCKKQGQSRYLTCITTCMAAARR